MKESSYPFIQSFIFIAHSNNTRLLLCSTPSRSTSDGLILPLTVDQDGAIDRLQILLTSGQLFSSRCTRDWCRALCCTADCCRRPFCGHCLLHRQWKRPVRTHYHRQHRSTTTKLCNYEICLIIKFSHSAFQLDLIATPVRSFTQRAP